MLRTSTLAQGAKRSSLSLLEDSLFGTDPGSYKSMTCKAEIGGGSIGTAGGHLHQGFHRGPVLRAPGFGVDVLRRARRLRRGGDIQGNRARASANLAGTQKGNGSRTDAANRCRPCLRALPMGAIDTGSARHAAPTGRMEGLGRRNERHDLRTRYATWPDDGHSTGRDRSIRARLDQ